MMKTIFMLAAMIAAAPALAQEALAPAVPLDQAAPAQPSQMSPQTEGGTAAPADAVPGTAAPVEEVAATNSADAVSQVVEAEFADYDGDANGELTRAEFTRWMTALRASQPGGAEGDSSSWANAAFAQADTDRDSAVSRGELTTFLQG